MAFSFHVFSNFYLFSFISRVNVSVASRERAVRTCQKKNNVLVPRVCSSHERNGFVGMGMAICRLARVVGLSGPGRQTLANVLKYFSAGRVQGRVTGPPGSVSSFSPANENKPHMVQFVPTLNEREESNICTNRICVLCGVKI
jgi:hypothetical protein